MAVSFGKLFAKDDFEYGLTDDITLFAVPEYVQARTQSTGAVYRAGSFTIEAGGRYRLFADAGVLSLQASYKTAGAFAMTVSDGKTSARQGELRLLYGTNFSLLGLDGFADFETAWRWIDPPNPDEIVADATAGIWVTHADLAMIQFFNIVSAGAGDAPYTGYRMHKVEFSTVRRIAEDWSVQTGMFVTFAGRNMVAERGMSVSLWVNF